MSQNKKSMRHELKYLISYTEAKYLSHQLNVILKQDTYLNGEQDYFIRSLYLDDNHNTSYWDKIAGVKDRKKYRIRIYNYDSDVIKLECKEKKGDRIHKESVCIDRECCDQLIQGNYELLRDKDATLCKEVYMLNRAKGLHNSVIVDYDREVYVYPISNVRITLDKNLHAAGIESYDLFQSDLLTMPIYQNQSVILEVKYDEVLPAFVREVLSTIRLGAVQSVSKYCICKDAIGRIKRG